jgi:hypothetical protein
MQKKSSRWTALNIVAFLMVSCASNPNKAIQIDTNIDHAQNIGANTDLGIKDGNTVVQRKVLMSEELRTLKIKAYDLEAEVYGGSRYFNNRGLWGVLRDCIFEKAKFENGGEGKLGHMPEERVYVIPDDQEREIGLDEKGKIVGLSEEFLKDALNRYREYIRVLSNRESDYNDRIAACNLSVHNKAKESLTESIPIKK